MWQCVLAAWQVPPCDSVMSCNFGCDAVRPNSVAFRFDLRTGHTDFVQSDISNCAAVSCHMNGVAQSMLSQPWSSCPGLDFQRGRNFCLCHHVQWRSETHQISSPVVSLFVWTWRQSSTLSYLKPICMNVEAKFHTFLPVYYMDITEQLRAHATPSVKSLQSAPCRRPILPQSCWDEKAIFPCRETPRLSSTWPSHCTDWATVFSFWLKIEAACQQCVLFRLPQRIVRLVSKLLSVTA